MVYVPESLRRTGQFVNYLLRRRADGKMIKIPIDPKTGRYADVSRPETWGTYAQACARLRSDPNVAGIGFVFSADDSLTGFDFDTCRDPRSGAVDPAVRTQVAELASYTEISLSGTGLHTIVQAQLPAGGCRRGKTEMYDKLRFFVLTGQHLPGTPTEIYPRQEQVDRLHQALFGQARKPAAAAPVRSALPVDDQTLIERILASRQGDRFQQLLRGVTSGYGSHSQADLAFCAMLASWTRDEQQIDRIVRASSLYREKWDAKRGPTTYGDLTILRALGQR